MSSNGVDESNTSESVTLNVEQDKTKRTKRKKASRACFHCQKAHLTCDDSRPCQRCIKRGLDATCQDGVRKKAKYLQDVEDANQVKGNQSSITPSNGNTPKVESPPATRATAAMPQMADLPVPEGTINMAAMTQPLRRSIYSQENFGVFGDNLLFDYPPLSTYDFDSKAANMEYSMLSNMLGNAGTPGTDYNHPSPDTFAFSSPGMNNLQRNMPSRQNTITPDQASIASEASWTQLQIGSTSHVKNKSATSNGSHQPGQPFPTAQISSVRTSPANMGPGTANSSLGTTRTTETSMNDKVTTTEFAKAMKAQGNVDPHGQRPTPVARRPLTTPGSDNESIYKSVTKPFSYTNGYHMLNTYLRGRFDKEDLLRIARAIVGYRPSFIALTKTLKEEDLVFMEVCFQRTLLEYEKFVGYSGTPTIIWRRTGQIELVGKEFCLLTQWSREQLLAKQTFIVELMDDSSVVEYFEKFSAHAFGDTSSVQTTCVLMTPQKRAVPCAFCFTIKRDVFDIPTMIVGNFLPVL